MMIVNSFVPYLLIIVLMFSDIKVAAQEGPDIVIAHSGQDVEILCTVAVTSDTQAAAWLINNNIGPYRINAIHGGTLAGYTATLGSNNLIVENIMMNDDRNGSDYRCVIVPANGRLTLADIIEESDPTILHVAVAAQEGPGTVIVHPAGQDVELLCSVAIPGTVQAGVTWIINSVQYGLSSLANGILIGYSADIISSNLIVKNIVMNDNRNNTEYRCVIIMSDMITEDSDPTFLYVTGVPTTVPNIIATVDDNIININRNNVTLMLSWGEPFNNLDPIVNYTVSCSGDVTCPPNFTTTDNTTRSYTITNLTPMTNYTFSVVATNSIGSGEAGVVMITTPSGVSIVRFTQSTYRVNEDDGSVQLALVLSYPAFTNVTVTVSSIDKSAKGDDDYVSGPFSVAIPAGQTNASFNVAIIDDNTFEGNEKFRLKIDQSSTLNDVLIGSPRKATVVIRDKNDCVPCNVTRNVKVSKGNATVTFSSGNSLTTFACKIDQSKSASCTSPMTYTNLNKGKHRIVVIASCPCKRRQNIIKRFRFWIR